MKLLEAEEANERTHVNIDCKLGALNYLRMYQLQVAVVADDARMFAGF